MTGHVSNQHGTPATSRYAGDVLPTRRPSRCGAVATLVFASPNVVLDNLIADEINLGHSACLRAVRSFSMKFHRHDRREKAPG